LSKQRQEDNWNHQYQQQHLINISLVALFIATIGTITEISGANFDITLHLHRHPGGERLLIDAETFLSPSHTILYSGVVITAIAAVIGIRALGLYGKYKLYSNHELKAETNSTHLSDEHDSPSTFSSSFIGAFKLLALGSGLTLVAGPFDLWWHSTLGLDGLLSPPHLFLITGMFVSALAVTIGLSRMIIRRTPMPLSRMKLVRAATILAFATLWLSSIWLIHAFVLPASKGQHFNFNMNPMAASIIAVITMPLIGSLIFMTASKVLARERFSGYTTIVVLIVAGTNVFANILTVGQLTWFLPWYIAITIIPAMISDILLNRRQAGDSFQSVSSPSSFNPSTNVTMTKTKIELVAGAIIGSTFYILDFPMLTLTFERLFGAPLRTIVQNLMPNFLQTLPLSLAISIVPGIIVGVIGAAIFSRKIKISIS
jgi:hypothetical protein